MDSFRLIRKVTYKDRLSLFPGMDVLHIVKKWEQHFLPYSSLRDKDIGIYKLI